MSRGCSNCGRVNNETAKFCKYCSASLTVFEAKPVNLTQSGSSVARSETAAATGSSAVAWEYCEFCRARVPVGVQFCSQCGKTLHVALPVKKTPPQAREGPPREMQRSVSQLQPGKTEKLPVANLIAGGGAIVGLIGCFAPLMTSMGTSISIIPTLVGQSSFALMVPLVLTGILLMAWGAGQGTLKNRVMLSGGIIALSSPLLTILMLFVTTAQKLSGLWGLFGGSFGVGIGIYALLIGFAVSLSGGFLILYDSVRT